MSIPISRLIVVARVVSIGLWCAPSAPANASELPDRPASPAAIQAAASTPGDVALLVLTPTDPGVLDRLVLALTDPNPEVRAVAARIAAVKQVKELAPALVRALPVESDGLAGAEMLRALLILMGAPADAHLLPHALRIGPEAARAYGDVLARVRPEAFLAALPHLVKVPGMEWDVGLLAALAMRRYPSHRQAVGSALISSRSAAALRALLAEPPVADGTDHTVAEALPSDAIDVREVAVWYVAERLLRGRKVHHTLIDAALPVGETSPGSRPATWETFGREIVARSRRPSGAASWDDFIRGHFARGHLLVRHVDSPLLTRPERAALEAMAPSEVRDVRVRRRSGPAQPEAHTFSGLSTMRWAVPGLGSQLLTATGCRASTATRAISAVVQYQPEGHLARATPNTSGASPACEKAARVALALGVAPYARSTVDGEERPLLIWLDREGLDCLKGSPPFRASADVPGFEPSDKIKAPSPLSTVHPEPPPGAVTGRIYGEVFLQAAVSPRGCVADVDVLQGVPALDRSAVVAILQWRFTPTLLQGQAIPVLVAMAVTFEDR